MFIEVKFPFLKNELDFLMQLKQPWTYTNLKGGMLAFLLTEFYSSSLTFQLK